MDKVEAIEAMANALREGSRFPSGQPRMSLDKCREIALTAAESFFELAANLNECIAELGDDEPFVVQRGPDGWEVRKMTAWKVLNQEVFADVRKEAIEEAAKMAEDAATDVAIRIDGMVRIRAAKRRIMAQQELRNGLLNLTAAIRALSDPPVLDEVVGTGEEQGNEWDDLR